MSPEVASMLTAPPLTVPAIRMLPALAVRVNDVSFELVTTLAPSATLIEDAVIVQPVEIAQDKEPELDMIRFARLVIEDSD